MKVIIILILVMVEFMNIIAPIELFTPELEGPNGQASIENERKNIADGFSYGPIDENVEGRIKGISFPEQASEISLEDLSYIHVRHYDFDGNIRKGELIVNNQVAKEVTEIFYELYKAKYPISSIRLIDDFGGDDNRSMEMNNSSGFNYRRISGSNKLSMHGKGLAIDINPLYNPYVTKNGISPAGSAEYADRSRAFAGKIDEQDLAYKLFIERGWTWGGSWKSLKDYQHFEKEL